MPDEIVTDAIINTKMPSPFQTVMALESWKSWDYYFSRPYPQHAFGPQQWPQDKGPRPTPLPYAEILIKEGAEFVFRNGDPVFTVPEDPDASAWLLETVINANDLSSRWVALAESAANHGAIAAKFAIDPNDPLKPVRITFLDVPQECRIWVDPHDADRTLMARIQYPYRGDDGRWWYFREEWTEAFWVSYHPKFAGDSNIANMMSLPDYTNHLGDVDGWETSSVQPNPLGCIPVTIIKNREQKGNPYGVGDCWNAWKLIDRIALTMHGEDKSNQLHSEPTAVVTNGKIDNEGPPQPGELISISNDKREGQPADYKLVEPSGAAREYSHRSMDRWEELLYKGVGLSRVDPAQVTNKGNMTELAFAMTYGRSISTSDMKRKNWGQSGLCRFFSNILRAAALMRLSKAIQQYESGVTISVAWPKYFEATPDDLKALTDRTSTQIEKGIVTPDRGIERVAVAEKIPTHEIKPMIEELRGLRLAAQAAQDPASGAAGSVSDTAQLESALNV